MLRVLPEVENVLMLEVAVGNAVGRVHHLENGLVVLVITRIGLENPGGSRVLGLDPLERLRAVNVLEPQIRIGARGVLPMRLTLLWSAVRSEEHTSELQSQSNLVCRLLLEKK